MRLRRPEGSLARMAPPDDGDQARPVAPIPHDALTLDHLPHPREPFDEVVRFAYTFDGYAALGMEMCGAMANRGRAQWEELGAVPAWLADDLERLRACIFFEARRWIVLAREPDTRSLMYVHDLVRAVEDRLLERDEAAN